MGLHIVKKFTRVARRKKYLSYFVILLGIVTVLHYKGFIWTIDESTQNMWKNLTFGRNSRSVENDLSTSILHKRISFEKYEIKVLNDEETEDPLSTTATEMHRWCNAHFDDPFFPLCRLKFEQLMSKHEWNQKCHGEKFKVNVSNPCSVLNYLSEVEPWCPNMSRSQDATKAPITLTSIQANITRLAELLAKDHNTWITTRITTFWTEWVNAALELKRKGKIQKRKRQSIAVFLGGIAYNGHLNTNAFQGGPLGELVQWSDVIAALYILGHQLVISASLDDVVTGRLFTLHDKGCGVKTVKHYDRILTDISGTILISNNLGPTFQKYSCKLLLLDSFGTEAEFNYQFYKEPMDRTPWGNLNLLLRQFMTMYPHSPDNLFMGFAVPNKPGISAAKPKRDHNKPKGVIYAKLPEYLKDKRNYLDVLNQYIDLHGTIAGKEHLRKKYVPEYVSNHGLLNGSQYLELLSEAKVLIGFGFPFEGPGPLDALANGCFYINPRLFPPKSRTNSEFFEGKPTSRQITSQSPYAEEFIGRPYVYTVDIDNVTQVENAIKEILASEERPYLPYQFTVQGMLERVNLFLENLDFCSSGYQWPPKSQMKIVKGVQGDSCKSACVNKGFICEPSFFGFLNDAKLFKRFGMHCKDYARRESIYAPTLNTTDQTCILQEMSLLYSCVARDDHMTRLCPCRTYQKEQVALYENIEDSNVKSRAEHVII